MTTTKEIATCIGSPRAGVRLVNWVCGAALAGILFAGCSKSDREAVPATGDGVIRINARIASTPQSRGVSLGNQAQSGIVLLRKDLASGSLNGNFSGATVVTADRATTGTLSNFSSKPLYNPNNNTAYFIGYHPAGTIGSGTTTWTIADGGKVDQLFTNTAWSAGNYLAPVTTGMTFDHQLAQLQVVCKADPNEDLGIVQSVWGQITKIEILETATTATLTHSTSTISFSGSATRTLSAADCETAFANVTLATNTTTPCAGGMFAPDLTGTKSLKLKVYTQTETTGQTVEVQLKNGTTNQGFTKGKTHKVVLTFGAVAKNITAVNNWTDNDEVEDKWGIEPTVEDYYYSDGTLSRELKSGKSVEGVVYWIDPANPKHFKIVSMDEPPANWDGGTNSAGRLKWSTKWEQTDVTSISDGKSNTLTLMKLTNAASTYPAAKWCYTKNVGLSVPAPSSATTADAGYGWYLPAMNELQHLFCAYRGAAPRTWPSGTSVGAPAAAVGYPAAWNARFTGATVFAPAFYWSSTEFSSSGSWCVIFDYGTTNSNSKTNTNPSTRCVREIVLP